MTHMIRSQRTDHRPFHATQTVQRQSVRRPERRGLSGKWFMSGSISRRVWSIGSLTALLVACATVHATTFSLKAVKLNPTCIGGAHAGEFCASDRHCDTMPDSFDGMCGGDITPTSSVSAGEGDIIVAEVYASDWAPGSGRKATSWQASLDADSFFSGSRGAVLPVGWDRPVDFSVCQGDADCPPEWPYCFLDATFCSGPNHDPYRSLFIDLLRTEFIFAGLRMVSAVDYRHLRTCSVLLLPSTGPLSVPPPKYCATLALEVRPDSCGTFTISLLRFVPGNGGDEFLATAMADENHEVILPVVLEPLTIDTGECAVACKSLESSDPPNCAIDARQPSDPDGSNPRGWNSIELRFDCADTSEITASDLSVTQTPVGDSHAPPIVTDLISDGDALKVLFDRPITLGAWTCVEYERCGLRTTCLGRLPGDVNGDLAVSAVDILTLVDNLNGRVDPELEVFQCDVDNSGICAPADILRLIDLLNGAGTYDPWLGKTLPPCPSRKQALPDQG